MSDLIDRNALKEALYHEAFETDSGEQKWDEGGLGMKEVLDYIGIEYSNGLLDLLEEQK